MISKWVPERQFAKPRLQIRKISWKFEIFSQELHKIINFFSVLSTCSYCYLQLCWKSLVINWKCEHILTEINVLHTHISPLISIVAKSKHKYSPKVAWRMKICFAINIRIQVSKKRHSPNWNDSSYAPPVHSILCSSLLGAVTDTNLISEKKSVKPLHLKLSST